MSRNKINYPFSQGVKMDKGFSYIDNIMSGKPFESLASRLKQQNEARYAAEKPITASVPKPKPVSLPSFTPPQSSASKPSKRDTSLGTPLNPLEHFYSRSFEAIKSGINPPVLGVEVIRDYVSERERKRIDKKRKHESNRGGVYMFNQDGSQQYEGLAKGRKDVLKGDASRTKIKKGLMGSLQQTQDEIKIELNEPEIVKGKKIVNKKIMVDRDMYTSNDEKQSLKMFKFAQKNTTPEWGLVQSRDPKNNKKEFSIYTNHLSDRASPAALYEKACRQIIDKFAHSHPRNSRGPGMTDIAYVEKLRQNKNVSVRKNLLNTDFSVYNRGERNFRHFNENGVIKTKGKYGEEIDLITPKL